MAEDRTIAQGAQAILDYLDELDADPSRAVINLAELPPELRDVGAHLRKMGAFISESHTYARELAAGDVERLRHAHVSDGNPIGTTLVSLRNTMEQCLGMARQIADEGTTSERLKEDGGFATAVNRMIDSVSSTRRELESAAHTDSLTGLGNHTAYEQRLDGLWEDGRSFTLAFADIDHLKTCNDRFGHREGDRYIQQAAFFLDLNKKEGEDVYRIGGDEFVLISTSAGEHELAERLEATRSMLLRSTAHNGTMPFSFSYGCSRVKPAAGESRQQATSEADRKMYSYKLLHRSGGVQERGFPSPADDDAFAFSERVFEALSMSLEGRYFFVADIDHDVSRWSSDAVHDLGLPAARMVGAGDAWLEHVHPDDREAYARDIHAIFCGKKHHHAMQYRARDAQGNYVVCKCKGFRLEGSDGSPALFVGTITNRNLAENIDPSTGLEDVNGYIAAIGDARDAHIPCGLVGIKVSGLAEANRGGGYEVGDRVFALYANRLAGDLRGRAGVYRGRGPQIGLIARNATPELVDDLARRAVELSRPPIQIDGKKYRITPHVATAYYPRIASQPYTVLGELTRRLRLAEGRDKAADAETARLEEEAARLDPLTGLRRGEDFIAAARRLAKGGRCMQWCLVSLDIGNMKIYNEWHGREAGDLLLAEVASILRDVESDGGLVTGYWGQDDFCVFMPLDQQAIEGLLARVTAAVARHDDSVGFLPSMGIFPIEHEVPVTVDAYAKALFANQKAKTNYENRIGFFRPQEYVEQADEHLIVSNFQYALSSAEITFHVQPQCDLHTGKVVGGEALVRWKVEGGEYVPPAKFIPVLEKNGFVTTLDKYVWHAVVKWQRELLDRGLEPVPVSVNASRVDIENFDVASFIGRMLRRYEVPASLIEVEITESSFVKSMATVRRLVGDLHALGVRVLMDDFGSGLSSLGMLRSVNVDVIKMDRSFLSVGSVDAERGTSIMDSILSLADSIDIPVIVEGAETAEQVELLARIGGKYVQGFYFYRPLEREAFARLLEQPSLVNRGGIR